MTNNAIIIQASANTKGNTFKVVNHLNRFNNFDVVDISTKNIGHFDYNFNNKEDDFLPLITRIIENYHTIIFATPVYWYSMSGVLKVFFDRLSDLLVNHKELGRQLRGKRMAVISNSNHNDLKNGFTMPFIASAKYLGMNYLGDIHVWFKEDSNEIDPDALKKIETYRHLLLK